MKSPYTKEELKKQLEGILEYDFRTDAKNATITQIYRAVNYLLLEDTVLIAYGVARGGIIAGSQTVHIASGKSSKTAVSKTGVRLLLINSVQLNAHICESLLRLVLHSQIVKAGLKRTPHKELHRQVINNGQKPLKFGKK